MCGIAGFTGEGNEQLLVDMTDIISHRGPDDRGYYISRDISLGNVRLSIIDVDSGRQPIYNEDRSVVVVYNGEIYNYRQLRGELESAGHVFTTATDTEVLVHLYEESGMGFLNRLYGIFAFALWDAGKKKLFLVRDQFGVKPLHYFFNGRTLVFASEIKAMLLHPDISPQLDREALHVMLNWRFVLGEKTLFKNILKVMPGCYLEYDGGISKTNYWKLDLRSDKVRSESYYKEGVRELFIEAVRKNTVSDVPIGAFLSGGLDSTCIAGVLSKFTSGRVNTFTLGFNTEDDECGPAGKTADIFGTAHHETIADADPLNSMPVTIWHSETPKINIIQQYLISQFAASEVKVVLSGQGGDELFGGQVNYDYVNLFKSLHSAFRGSVPRRIMNGLSRLIFMMQSRLGGPGTDEYRRGIQMLLSYGDPTRYYSILRNVWDYDRAFYGNIYACPEEMLAYDAHSDNSIYFAGGRDDFLSQVLQCEISRKLVEDGLHIEDRMSMAWSLESRVPFLDKDLVEFAAGIPAAMKIKNGRKKYIFREAFRDMLPDYIINRPKQGFGFNPFIQFRRDLKSVAEKILTERRIREQGIFNYNYIRSIIDHKPKYRMRWHYFYLWNIIGFQIWYDMFIVRKPHEKVSFELNDYMGNK